MPTTPKRAYPFPAGNVTPNVPYWLQQIAVAVENDVADLTFDTGWMDLPLAAGWAATEWGARYRRKSNVVYFQVSLRPRSWTAGQIIATMPAGYRPIYRTYFSSSYDGGVANEIQLNSNGQLTVIKAGNTGVIFSGSYPID